MRRTDEHTGTPGRGASTEDHRRLRLVANEASTPREASRAGDASERPARVRADRGAHRAWEVSAENRTAASIAPSDARWILAVRASDAIEGGRAAVIRPEARERLVHTAGAMGLRPFDANLVLAIVQDAARQGRTPQDADTVDRLTMVGPAERSAPGRQGLWVLVLLCCSAVWGAALLWWLLG